MRHDALASLGTMTFDVVVIGAGMTGCGVALDAASRGLRVALIDGSDIAAGTSSKSSKMVHGGLRYLQQREFRLVYENLRERQRLLENAPFLIRPLPFLIPLFGNNGVASKALIKGYSTALWLYDLTGGWRIGQRHRRISRAQVLELLPTLNADSLAVGFLYLDARGDDARVALTLARTAALDFDVVVANYVRATDITHDQSGRVSSVEVRDELGGATLSVMTNFVVNATGVWADDVFKMAEHSSQHMIRPAKGVHISVPRARLPAEVAAVLNVPGDRRSIFVVPFEDAPFTFIGTTDTPYDGDLDHPECTLEDVNYLLGAVNAAMSSSLSVNDVTGVWAGLRPLLTPREGHAIRERTADLSRRHQVTDSRDGVIHITGGKWTTYRQMAEDTVDAMRPYLKDLGRARTKHLRLHGTGEWRPHSPLETHLYRRYGEDAVVILNLIAKDQTLSEVAIAGQSYVYAEFLYAVHHEMATSLIDLLTRRTRAHLHDARSTLEAAPTIASLVAHEIGWSAIERDRQVSTYRDLVEHELRAAGVAL